MDITLLLQDSRESKRYEITLSFKILDGYYLVATDLDSSEWNLIFSEFQNPRWILPCCYWISLSF